MDDLLFALLDLAFDMIGKFWPVILAYLGYKLFGGLGKRMSEGKAGSKPVRRMSAGPVLTPVEGGGFPRHVETVQPDPLRVPMREQPVSQAAEDLPSAETAFAKLPAEDSSAQPLAAAETNSPALAPDPREGLKWAMIFSPPRAKSPLRGPGCGFARKQPDAELPR
jgi:hypothetical protein